jgi:hypothetical protein
MKRAALISLALVLVPAWSGCPRSGHSADASHDDAGPVDAFRIADPADLYLQCTPGSSCDDAREWCLLVNGGSDTAWCTYRCLDDGDCPDGLCLRISGTTDDGPRCHERCVVSADCSDPTFGCFHVGIMSTAGDYETDLCYPE